VVILGGSGYDSTPDMGVSVQRTTLIICVGAAAATAANVVANVAPVPKSWDPYLWAAWPALAILAAVAVIVEKRRPSTAPSADGPPSSTSAPESRPHKPTDRTAPPSAVQNNTALGGNAYGAMFGNVVIHPNPAATPDPSAGPPAQP
jgi:hypothetical protein